MGMRYSSACTFYYYVLEHDVRLLYLFRVKESAEQEEYIVWGWTMKVIHKDLPVAPRKVSRVRIAKMV